MVRRYVLGLVFLLSHAVAAMAGDPVAGEQVFKKCIACHAVGENAQIKVGPVLNALIGRKAGTYAGYSYTDANKNSNIVWDEATLAKYLQNPRAMIPGTKMVFAGLKRESEIQDVIAYLAQFGPDGKPKP